MRSKIIAVDFDGTLVEAKWPEIGVTNNEVLSYCKREQVNGARIILWTNRVGDALADAVKWCERNGLRLDAVNDNLQESIDIYGFNSRKICADEFIDDRMVRVFDLPYIGTDEGEESVGDVFNTLSKKQKKVVYALIASALESTNDNSACKECDTLVCESVKKDPLAFVGILEEQAEAAEKGERALQNLAPLLHEAASVIANLLLTDEQWQKKVEKKGFDSPYIS